MGNLLIRLLRSCCLVAALLLVNASASAEEDGLWKAGRARVKITPDSPIWLAGYASRTHPSEGTLQDIWAKAISLEDSHGHRGVVVTMDLLSITKEISDSLRDRLLREYGLSRSQIILNVSHTHSGPVIGNGLGDIYPMTASDQERVSGYTGWLMDRLVNLVGESLRDLRPARISTGSGMAGFAVNRRNNVESEVPRASELKGPSDHTVPVLKVEDEEGKLSVVLFGYSCHNTVLSDYLVNGDYAGYAQAELEKAFPGTMAMFFQGAGADQNPLPRRKLSYAVLYGKELAAAVSQVLSEEMIPLDSRLDTRYKEIPLEMEAPLPLEELSAIGKGDDYQARWARGMVARYGEKVDYPSEYPYPVQYWEIGSQRLFALGGELVCGYSLDLKSLFGNETIVMGYSNDIMSYIPTEKIWDEGGYEGFTAHRVYGLPSRWTRDVQARIMEAASSLAGKEITFKPGSLQGERIYSGFPDAHDTYNAISVASDGMVYYVLSSQRYDVGGQFCRYDPSSGNVEILADLSEAVGEKRKKFISQGKSHVEFEECEGKLYFATHVGYYQMIDGAEQLPVDAPKGWRLYPGGHFLSYDMATGKIEDLAVAPDGEGIITMAMDKVRKHLFGLTWPSGILIDYDIENSRLRDLGHVTKAGETGLGTPEFRVICRSMFVDPRDGSVYWSTADGDIWTYNPSDKGPSKVEGVDLRLDYFGKYDPSDAGSMGYNWRKIKWYAPEGKAYAVHGNSGYLFTFDPVAKKVEIVDRITSEPSRKSGMGDQFSYGYLGFTISDQGRIYYLTGAPVYKDGKRVAGLEKINMGAAKGIEYLHLVTYDIPRGRYEDLGPVFYDDGSFPTYVNSIALGKDGDVYTLARFLHEGKEIEDLVRIKVNQ
ncbi:MAG: neutral/alkaline non-lysosomal ceramidase N-terminal domain-containing protein [Bacteroidales bacterium]|nr:neutral/alkaline non-lysosomal ceramidase N-terminal domain-containing protein [Bacteroidales bacterium]